MWISIWTCTAVWEVTEPDGRINRVLQWHREHARHFLYHCWQDLHTDSGSGLTNLLPCIAWISFRLLGVNWIQLCHALVKFVRHILLSNGLKYICHICHSFTVCSESGRSRPDYVHQWFHGLWYPTSSRAPLVSPAFLLSCASKLLYIFSLIHMLAVFVSFISYLDEFWI